MANEKRLIDANALKRKLYLVTLYVPWLRFGKTAISKILESYRLAVFEEIDKAPTVDAVEVVHCCDCQSCTAFQQFADSEVILFCEKWKGHPKVDPTDFCSYGERRE